VAESKQCAECGTTFTRKQHRSHAQWAKQTCCTTACANTVRAKQQTKLPATTRRAGERWARWWEQERRREDRLELRSWKRKHGPHCRLTAKPTTRHFVARWCKACGAEWLNYSERMDADYCSPCNAKRWRDDGRHKRRAWKANAANHEVVSAEEVFKRDGYRCQICGTKTRGKFPALTSPSLDHIIPLSKGGEHSYLNVQCACFGCNSRKGAGSANDQLKLIA
jgi:hypothetical protein